MSALSAKTYSNAIDASNASNGSDGCLQLSRADRSRPSAQSVRLTNPGALDSGPGLNSSLAVMEGSADTSN